MVRKYFFNRNQRTKAPKSNDSTVTQITLGSVAQSLQQTLHEQVAQPNRLQIRCAIREGNLLVLVEHLLHVEPDPQQTFNVLEQFIEELVPDLIASDPDCSPADRAQPLPVRLYLRVAGYQQPYAFHSLTVEPIAPVVPSPVSPPEPASPPRSIPVVETSVSSSSDTALESAISGRSSHQEPSHQESSHQEPSHQEPSHQEPNTSSVDESTINEAINGAIVHEATVQELTIEQPTVDEATAQELTTEQSILDEPVVDEPVVDEPVVDEPIVDELVVDEPVVANERTEDTAIVSPLLENEPIADRDIVDSMIADPVIVEEPIADVTAVVEPSIDESIVDEEIVPPIQTLSDSPIPESEFEAEEDVQTDATGLDYLESPDYSDSLDANHQTIDQLDEPHQNVDDQNLNQLNEFYNVDDRDSIYKDPERLDEHQDVDDLDIIQQDSSRQDLTDQDSNFQDLDQKAAIDQSLVQTSASGIVEAITLEETIDTNALTDGESSELVSIESSVDDAIAEPETIESITDRSADPFTGASRRYEPELSRDRTVASQPSSIELIDDSELTETLRDQSSEITDVAGIADVEAIQAFPEFTEPEFAEPSPAIEEPLGLGVDHFTVDSDDELDDFQEPDFQEFIDDSADDSAEDDSVGTTEFISESSSSESILDCESTTVQTESNERVLFADNSVIIDPLVDYSESDVGSIASDPVISNSATPNLEIYPLEIDSIESVDTHFVDNNQSVDERLIDEQFADEQFVGELLASEQFVNEKATNELSTDEQLIDTHINEFDLNASTLTEPNLAKTEQETGFSSELIEDSNTTVAEPIADPWNNDERESSLERPSSAPRSFSSRKVSRDRSSISNASSAHVPIQSPIQSPNHPKKRAPAPPALVIPNAKSAPSSFDHLPLDLDAFPKQSRRSSITLLGAMITGSVGLFILLGGAYVLTRPCVLGDTCQPLENAQQLSKKALGIVQNNPSALEVVDAYDQLIKANQLLDTIPLWSKHRADAQNLLSQYQEELEELSLVVQSLNQANIAVRKSLNPPHPVQVWREVQWIWREAIDILDQVPADSLVYTLAQDKRAEYQSNLDGINHRIVVEQESQERIDAIKKATDVIDARSRIVNSAESWQQTSDSWQTVIDNLRQIPQGTMAHAEAARLITIYQLKLEDSERRRTREESSIAAYNESLNLADQARRFEQQQQWAQAVTYWRDAITTLKQISEGTTRYSQSQTLLEPYTTSLNRAETNLKQSTLLQTLKPQLDRACSGTPQPCTYTVAIESVRIYLTPDYDRVVQQVFLAAQSGGSSTVQADITNRVNQFLRSLASISETAQVPLELYNSGGSKFGTYDPTRSGYIAQ